MPGVGPWLSTELVPGYSGDDLEPVGAAVPLLPDPEHAIHEAVMEEEDRIETRGVVLAHVAVRPVDRRAVVMVGMSQPPTARWMLLCGVSSGTTGCAPLARCRSTRRPTSCSKTPCSWARSGSRVYFLSTLVGIDLAVDDDLAGQPGDDVLRSGA